LYNKTITMEYEKYLIKIPVLGDVRALLDEEKGVPKPSSGFHVTITLFHMYENAEKQLSGILNNIHTPPFSLQIVGKDVFGDVDYPVQVLLTSLPVELRQLHVKIITALHSIEGVSSNLRETERKYYGCWYAPHISLSKSKESVRLHHEYKGMVFPVTSFDLMKKKECGWQKIHSYSLS
jgi:2'-5' RNA ligase